MSHRRELLSESQVAKRRLWTYGLVVLVIAPACIALQFTSWRGSAELHTVMEVVATTLALVVAAMAPFRYYSKEDAKFLFIGTGFFATALLDGYHALVTSTSFRDYYPSPPESLIPWSWMTGRTFLATLMVVSWWSSQQTPAWHVRASRVYAIVTLLSVTTFLFFAFVPMHQPQAMGALIGRPEELLIAIVFFGAAHCGYLHSGTWRAMCLRGSSWR